MMANRSDRRLLTLRCVRALEAVGMSTRTRRADFHQGQGSFATPISQAGYMTATRFPLSVPHPCTRAGSIYDTKKNPSRGGLSDALLRCGCIGAFALFLIEQRGHCVQMPADFGGEVAVQSFHLRDFVERRVTHAL